MHKAEELERRLKFGFIEDSSTAFQDYAEGWLSRQRKYAPSTLASYRRLLEVVYPFIGAIPLYKLRPLSIENMLSQLRKRKDRRGQPVRESTVQHYLSAVSAVLSDAKRNEIIQTNPARMIDLPSTNRMGYDYSGNRIKSQQKTVRPPEGLAPKQTEKWLNEQAVLFERACKDDPQPQKSLTLAQYTALWLRVIAPGKLAKSTLHRDKQDTERFLPALGHYRLTELRQTISSATGKSLSENTIEGVHATLCSILSNAVEGGFLTHNPAWRTYRYASKKTEKKIADEETAQKIIAALEKEPKTRSGDRYVYFSAEMESLLREYRRACQYITTIYDERELDTNDFLFRRQGTRLPMTPTTFTWRFKCIPKKNGLPQELNVHSLRHTAASLMIAGGADVATVAGILGHSQPSTTLDIYTHAFDKNKKAASAGLQEMLEI